MAEAIDDARAATVYGDNGTVVVTRDPPVASVTTRHELEDGALLHPYFATVGASFAVWLGRLALHAGGFLFDGHAWGVVGQNEAGKSTALAMLSRRGVDILTDDLLVVSGNEAFAGPRVLDLRPGAAHMLGMGEWHESHPKRQRWRVALPNIPPQATFAGLVFLRWGDTLNARRVPPAEVLSRLLRDFLWWPVRHDQRTVLNTLGVPAFEVTRPRGLRAGESAVTLILELAAAVN